MLRCTDLPDGSQEKTAQTLTNLWVLKGFMQEIWDLCMDEEHLVRLLCSVCGACHLEGSSDLNCFSEEGAQALCSLLTLFHSTSSLLPAGFCTEMSLSIRIGENRWIALSFLAVVRTGFLSQICGDVVGKMRYFSLFLLTLIWLMHHLNKDGCGCPCSEQMKDWGCSNDINQWYVLDSCYYTKPVVVYRCPNPIQKLNCPSRWVFSPCAELS